MVSFLSGVLLPFLAGHQPSVAGIAMEGLVLYLGASDFFTADVGFYASFPFWFVVMH